MAKIKVKKNTIKAVIVILLLVLGVIVYKDYFKKVDLTNQIDFNTVSNTAIGSCISQYGSWFNESNVVGCVDRNGILSCNDPGVLMIAQNCTSVHADWHCNSSSIYCSYS